MMEWGFLAMVMLWARVKPWLLVKPWVHQSAPNAFSELSIFRHCVSRQGVHVVERYQDWRLNDVLPAGNGQDRVNHTSVHCKTCGRALDRYLRAIHASASPTSPTCRRATPRCARASLR